MHDIFRFGKHFENKPGKPTFSEFLDWRANIKEGGMRELNTHWVPVHDRCCPCSINYKFILKTENLSKETNAMLKMVRQSFFVQLLKHAFPSRGVVILSDSQLLGFFTLRVV